MSDVPCDTKKEQTTLKYILKFYHWSIFTALSSRCRHRILIIIKKVMEGNFQTVGFDCFDGKLIISGVDQVRHVFSDAISESFKRIRTTLILSAPTKISIPSPTSNSITNPISSAIIFPSSSIIMAVNHEMSRTSTSAVSYATHPINPAIRYFFLFSCYLDVKNPHVQYCSIYVQYCSIYVQYSQSLKQEHNSIFTARTEITERWLLLFVRFFVLEP